MRSLVEELEAMHTPGALEPPELELAVTEPAPKVTRPPEFNRPPQLPAALVSEWVRLRPLLEPALEGGLQTIEDVERMIGAGQAQFWPGRAAAIVTEIKTFPTEKVCLCSMAGGDMAEILAMAPGLESWARLQGCSSVLVEGRAGWERMLKPAGFEPFSVTLRKAL